MSPNVSAQILRQFLGLERELIVHGDDQEEAGGWGGSLAEPCEAHRVRGLCVKLERL